MAKTFYEYFTESLQLTPLAPPPPAALFVGLTSGLSIIKEMLKLVETYGTRVTFLEIWSAQPAALGGAAIWGSRFTALSGLTVAWTVGCYIGAFLYACQMSLGILSGESNDAATVISNANSLGIQVPQGLLNVKNYQASA